MNRGAKGKLNPKSSVGNSNGRWAVDSECSWSRQTKKETNDKRLPSLFLCYSFSLFFYVRMLTSSVRQLKFHRSSNNFFSIHRILETIIETHCKNILFIYWFLNSVEVVSLSFPHSVVRTSVLFDFCLLSFTFFFEVCLFASIRLSSPFVWFRINIFRNLFPPNIERWKIYSRPLFRMCVNNWFLANRPRQHFFVDRLWVFFFCIHFI